MAFVGARLVQEDLPVWLQVAALILFGGLLALALVIAAVFFATVTLLLHERALVAFAGRVPVLDVGTISDFYLWHIADAVPLLKVPETLHWQPPLTYEHAGVGWLLLLFKVAVVLPGIAAFRAYWKVLHASPSTSEPADAAGTGPST